jgi:S1-C subfamily serine protease
MSAGKGASSGVGFAIPVDTVKGLVDQILQYGRVMRPSLGVVIAPPQALQRIGEQGVLVLDVSHST